jgi:Protein of unknown function (DUF3306)
LSEDGEGFLSRWSRRKRAAAVASPSPPAVAPEAVPPPDAAAPSFDPASLPAPESLTVESDFAAFLREEVPAALRRSALRRAWTLDPAIRDFVGPADYAWDFNAPDGVPGFSPELGGDLERLIAQAVGLEETPAAEEERAEAPPAPVGPIAPPPEPEASALAAATPTSPEPGALPAREPAVAESRPPLQRRHGGALPS